MIFLVGFFMLSVSNSVNAVTDPNPYIDRLFLPYSIDERKDTSITPLQECLVPCDRIVQGQVKDGIPSIDNPVFVASDSSDAPSDSETIIGIVIGGVAKAYPYNILNWHEIVNEEINGIYYSVTLCPLTGSGMLFKTNVIDGSELGTSGFLYENNLVFYDRKTDSQWSQMLSQSITGERIGQEIEYSEAIETTWKAWKQLYPDTIVLSEDTGYSRSYDRYPYGAYRSDGSIYFPTTFDDSKAPYNLYQEKAITQIIKISGETLLLPLLELSGFTSLNHEFQNTNLVTFFSEDSRLAITYESTVLSDTSYFAEYIGGSFSEDLTFGFPIYIDGTGTVWNIKGTAISGPNSGETLKVVPTYNAFWFAASTFFYDASILSIADGTTQVTITQIDQTEILNETDFSDQYNIESNTDVTPKYEEVAFLDSSPLQITIIAFVVLIIVPKVRRKKEI